MSDASAHRLRRLQTVSKHKADSPTVDCAENLNPLTPKAFPTKGVHRREVSLSRSVSFDSRRFHFRASKAPFLRGPFVFRTVGQLTLRSWPDVLRSLRAPPGWRILQGRKPETAEVVTEELLGHAPPRGGSCRAQTMTFMVAARGGYTR